MRGRLTYANLMATIAVFIALGGSAYAAAQLQKNSVGSAQLQKNAVITSKIKNEAVTGAKIKKDSLTGRSIDEKSLGVLPSSRLAIHATSADQATTAQIAGHAVTSDQANIAGTAENGGTRIDYDEAEKQGAALVPILELEGLRLRARCNAEPAAGNALTLDITSTTAARASWFLTGHSSGGGPSPSFGDTPLAANAPAGVIALNASTGTETVSDGQLIYRSANHVIAILVHAVAADSIGRCRVTGVAIPTG